MSARVHGSDCAGRRCDVAAADQLPAALKSGIFFLKEMSTCKVGRRVEIFDADGACFGGEIFIAKTTRPKMATACGQSKGLGRSARGGKTDGLTEGINVRLIVHCSVVVSPSPPG